MIKKTSLLALEILAAIVTAIVVVVGLFLWRLSQGPINVPYLTGQIESRLSDMSNAVNIDVDQTILTWDRIQEPLAIHVQGVKILNPKGGEVATIDELSMTVSMPDLLIGRIMPRSITLFKPSVAIKRNEDGIFDINLSKDGALSNNPVRKSDLLRNILDHLSNPDAVGSAKRLKELNVIGATVFYTDMINDMTLTAPVADIFLSKNDQGLLGVASVSVDINGHIEALRGELTYDVNNKNINVALAINNFNPKQLAVLKDEFGVLSNMDMPLTGVITVGLNDFFQILSFDIKAKGASGTLTIPDLYDRPLPVDGATLDVQYNPNDGSVFIKQFALDMDGFRTDIQGRITQDFDQRQVNISTTAAVFGIDVNQLKTYWPMPLAPKPRQWVTTHLSNGSVSKATADISLSVPIDDLTQITVDEVQGTILFNDTDVDYLPPMPVVNDVDGTASFTKNNFSLDLTNGTLRSSQLTKATLDITGFDVMPPTMDIDLTINGSVSDALYVLGADPLNFTDKLGLANDAYTGDAVTNLTLNFPLSSRLKKSEVTVAATSTITNVVAQDVFKQFDATSDQLSLTADNKSLSITGDIKINGVDAALSWVENFGKNVDFIRNLTVKGPLNPAQLGEFTGYPFTDYVTGDVSTTAAIREDEKGVKTYRIDMNFTEADVAIPILNFNKKTGKTSIISTTITTPDSGELRFDPLHIIGEDMTATGTASFNNGAFDTASLSNIKIGQTNANVQIDRQNDRYHLAVSGQKLDMTSLWQQYKNKQANQTVKQAPHYPRLSLSLDMNEMVIVPGHPLSQVKGFVELYPDYIDRAEIDATVNQAPVYLRYTPKNDSARARSPHTLRFETSNAGALLTAIDITKKIRGGTMIIDANSMPTDIARLTGGISMRNFTIIDAPVLGRIINALSPAGLFELLNNEGLNFAQLESQWNYKNGLLSIEKGRAAGSSIGLNFTGTYNRPLAYIDIEGTFVPVNPLNTMIGGLPIVGQILGGAKGEGLIAATYHVHGDADDPSVTVNPLSALTPGILRTIFFETEY